MSPSSEILSLLFSIRGNMVPTGSDRSREFILTGQRPNG